MKSFKANIEQILHALKHELPSKEISLLSVYRTDEHIANLRVINKTMLSSKKVIRYLTKWRLEHQDAFPSQFGVTEEGTQKWGQAQLLNLSDRILFFLEDLQGKPFAHLGLFRFDYQKKSCEIDNVVRGENLIPGSMTDALSVLIEWT